MKVNIYKTHPDAIIPDYQSSGAACFDFHLLEDSTIDPGEIKKLRTGLIIQTPPGHALMVYDRSSNPVKRSIIQPHSVGVVDSDFQGPEDEIMLLFKNTTDQRIEFSAKTRLAQGMIVPVPHVEFVEVSEIAGPSRGGHGSTGE